jgi:hypothetical protein
MSSHADRVTQLNRGVKQQPSLEGFIAWLETKDPDESFNYHDSDMCACGQYAKSIGTEMWGIWPEETHTAIWDRLNGVACSRDAQRNWTFGHTLEVAREMLKFERAMAA